MGGLGEFRGFRRTAFRSNRAGTFAFVLGLLMCVIAVAAVLQVRREIISAFSDLKETHDLEVRVERLLSGLVDAETGYRGFLITSDPALLEPYDLASTAMPKQLDDIRALISDEPVLGAIVIRYAMGAAQTLAAIRTQVEARRNGPLSPDALVAGVVDVKRQLDSVRDANAAFQNTLRNQLAERRQAIERIISSLLMTVVFLLVGVCLASAAQTRALIGQAVRFLRMQSETRAEIEHLEDDLSRSRAELSELNGWLAIALRSAQVTVFTVDRSGNVTWVNDASAAVFSRHALPVSLPALAPEPDRPRIAGVIAGSFDDSNPVSFEMRVEGPLGTPLWLKITIAPDQVTLNGDALAAAVDITDLKRREDGNFWLMRELSHRSKNLLAIVQAMARQTARTVRHPDEFQRRFSARLQALAAAHDLLVKAAYAGAELGELLRSQLGPLEGWLGSRISVSGPSVRLRPEAAQNLGMALHELATNAHVHGALSTAQGMVEVRWALEGEGRDASLLLEWTEHGGPEVSPSTRVGFGTTLIAANLPRALLGEVRLQHRPEGTHCHMTLPMAIIAENAEAPLPFLSDAAVSPHDH